MLKRGRRFAQARLPAVAAPTGQAARPAAGEPSHSDWPALPEAPGHNLWLAISFIPLNTELERFLSSENWRGQLARWALNYTPVVSVDPDGALLLEIGGSLKLFGGLQALRQRMQAALAEQGVTAVLACAPTARAAGWLARAGMAVACTAAPAAAQALGAVPVAALGWPIRVRQKLQQMGVHTLADCRRLPRDGFARRIGREYLQAMDEAFGNRLYQPLPYVGPVLFRDRLELSGETLDAAVLLAATDSLLQQLQAFLRRRQAAVQTVLLRFEHTGCPPSRCRVSGGQALTQTGHLLELTGLKLERMALPEPVTAVALAARAQPESVYATADLPGVAPAVAVDPARRAQLLARLQARLGASRVHGLALVAEHRPEKAWHVREQGHRPLLSTGQRPLSSAGQRPLSSAGQRPLWLLQQPRRIEQPDAAVFLRHAERIESGWWDGHDIRRDYYSVSGPAGSRWWIYRDCRDRHWYLHGLFG